MLRALTTIILSISLACTVAAEEVLFSLPGSLNDSFGHQIITINDTTADGIPEVVISSITYDSGPNGDAGALNLYNGSLQQFIGDHVGGGADYLLGLRVENLGDINSDGFDEYAYYEEFDAFLSEVGRVRIYSSDGFSHVRDHTGFEAQGYFGSEILAAGDLNGNGTADYVLYGGKNGDGRGRRCPARVTNRRHQPRTDAMPFPKGHPCRNIGSPADRPRFPGEDRRHPVVARTVRQDQPSPD
jgi:hypothetical protein